MHVHAGRLPVNDGPGPCCLRVWSPDEVESGGHDETLGDCTSLFDEWPAASNIDNLDLPVIFDGGAYQASGVSVFSGRDYFGGPRRERSATEDLL